MLNLAGMLGISEKDLEKLKGIVKDFQELKETTYRIYTLLNDIVDELEDLKNAIKELGMTIREGL